jgi:hypothetical protein
MQYLTTLPQIVALTQMRASVFYTNIELSNRKNETKSSALPYRIPTIRTRDFTPLRNNVLHYQPDDDDFIRCQFADCNSYRSTQHYILECQKVTIVLARQTAFEQLQHLLQQQQI